MGKPAFSDRGEAPTEYERALFEQSHAQDPRHVRQLWLLIGQRIGLDALCVVLDELGGITNMSAPSRERFFADLAMKSREQEIARRRAGKEPMSRIAAELGISKRTVYRHCARIRVRCRSERGMSPQWSKRSRGSRTR